MYTRKDKLKAIELFIKYDFIPTSIIRELGYPSSNLLAEWIDELEPGRRPKRPALVRTSEKAKEHAAIDLITRKGAAKGIADGLGIERATLYNWKRKLLNEEVPCKMVRISDDKSVEELEQYAETLRRDTDRLELQRAILEGTVELLGKDRSVGPEILTNREKTILVESSRPAHRLNVLLDAVGMAKAATSIRKEPSPDRTDTSICASAQQRSSTKAAGAMGIAGYTPFSDRRISSSPRRSSARSWKTNALLPSAPSSASAAPAKAR